MSKVVLTLILVTSSGDTSLAFFYFELYVVTLGG